MKEYSRGADGRCVRQAWQELRLHKRGTVHQEMCTGMHEWLALRKRPRDWGKGVCGEDLQH